MIKGTVAKFKTFEFKGQMINYYNKVVKNARYAHCYCYLDAETGKYTVMYWQKGNKNDNS